MQYLIGIIEKSYHEQDDQITVSGIDHQNYITSYNWGTSLCTNGCTFNWAVSYDW